MKNKEKQNAKEDSGIMIYQELEKLEKFYLRKEKNMIL